jgi:hypothetical protein
MSKPGLTKQLSILAWFVDGLVLSEVVVRPAGQRVQTLLVAAEA